jgi:rhodanese-related sulfurtransferase
MIVRMRFRIAVLTLLWLTGCSDALTWKAVETMITTSYPGVHEVSTDSLARTLVGPDSGRTVILDVRTQAEYDVSHIKGAIRIDPDEPDFTPYLNLDPATPIYTYCSVGYRSARIADLLQKQGFSRVSNVMGAIFRWVNEDRVVVRADTAVEEVHPFDSIWGGLLREDYRAFSPGNTSQGGE